jgi:hypothetical protein
MSAQVDGRSSGWWLVTHGRQTCGRGAGLSRVVAVTVPGRVVADEVAGLDVDEVRAVVVAADLPSELCAIDPFGEWLYRDRFEDILAKFSKFLLAFQSSAIPIVPVQKARLA